MLRNVAAGFVLVVAAFAMSGPPALSAQGPQVTRKMLIQRDLPVQGWTSGLISVEIPVGGREGRHTHPGPLFVYVTEGAFTLDYEGQPTKTYKAGETFYVEGGKVHEGINMGTVPARGIASFVVPKDKPLTTQVK